MAKQEALSLRVTKGHCLGSGRGDVLVGAVLTVPEDLTVAEARQKVAIGYAVEIPSEIEPADDPRAPVEAPGTVESRDPEIKHGDPAPPAKPKSKRSKKKPRSGK